MTYIAPGPFGLPEQFPPLIGDEYVPVQAPGSPTRTVKISNLIVTAGNPGVFNVKSTPYNATGGGIVDDTAAIQAAIDAASAVSTLYGNIVYFPPGRYKITGLTLAPGVALVGAGKYASILEAGASSITLLNYLATVPRQQFVVRDLGFNGANLTTVRGINLDGNTSAIRISNIDLQDLDFTFFTDDCIHTHFTANLHGSNITARSCRTLCYIDNGADTFLSNCKGFAIGNFGFIVVGGAGAFDEGLRMTHCETNTGLAGTGGGLSVNGADFIEVANCSFSSCPSLNPLKLVTCVNAKLVNVELASAAAVVNADLQGCTRLHMSQCGLTNATGQFGMLLTGCLNSTISDCDFVANSFNDLVVTGGSGNNIHHNRCATVVAANIVEQGGADYNLFDRNIVKGATTLVGANSVKTDFLRP